MFCHVVAKRRQPNPYIGAYLVLNLGGGRIYSSVAKINNQLNAQHTCAVRYQLRLTASSILIPRTQKKNSICNHKKQRTTQRKTPFANYKPINSMLANSTTVPQENRQRGYEFISKATCEPLYTEIQQLETEMVPGMNYTSDTSVRFQSIPVLSCRCYAKKHGTACTYRLKKQQL